MTLAFTKMQGAGNDFVMLDGVNGKLPPALSELSRRLCDRHFGVGADQVIVALPSSKADIRMEIYNADGSKVEMCGNGVRCLIKYALDKKLARKEELRVETPAGIIVPRLIPDHPRASKNTAWVEVDMGRPELEGEKIPVIEKGRVIGREFYVESDTLLPGDPDKVMLTCVSMGNPHAVVFVDNVEKFPVARMGPVLENHPFFPRRTNVAFVKIKSRERLQQRTWERGSGETLACGTAASAVCVAAVLNGFAERSVTVSLPGGDLELRWDERDCHVFMTGPATAVFEGEFTADETVAGYKGQFSTQVARLRQS